MTKKLDITKVPMKKTYWMVVTKKGKPIMTNGYFMVCCTKKGAQQDLEDLHRHGSTQDGVHIIPIEIKSKEKFKR